MTCWYTRCNICSGSFTGLSKLSPPVPNLNFGKKVLGIKNREEKQKKINTLKLFAALSRLFKMKCCHFRSLCIVQVAPRGGQRSVPAATWHRPPPVGRETKKSPIWLDKCKASSADHFKAITAKQMAKLHFGPRLIYNLMATATAA